METHLLHQVPSELSDTSIPCRGGFIYGQLSSTYDHQTNRDVAPIPNQVWFPLLRLGFIRMLPRLILYVASIEGQNVATVEGHTI